MSRLRSWDRVKRSADLRANPCGPLHHVRGADGKEMCPINDVSSVKRLPAKIAERHRCVWAEEHLLERVVQAIAGLDECVAKPAYRKGEFCG